jgi:hypothetical protein
MRVPSKSSGGVLLTALQERRAPILLSLQEFVSAVAREEVQLRRSVLECGRIAAAQAEGDVAGMPWWIIIRLIASKERRSNI